MYYFVAAGAEAGSKDPEQCRAGAPSYPLV